MSWTRDEVTLLLEEYRKWPNLYKIKSANYKNRNLRKQALEGVLVAMKEVKREVTIPEIQSKFQALKQTATKEKKKMAESQKSGAGFDDIVEPSLWYYSLISYIFDDAEPRKGIDSLDDDIENSQASTNFQNWTDPQEEELEEQEEIILMLEEDKENYLFSPETSRPQSSLSIQGGQTPSRPAASVRTTPARPSLTPIAEAPKGKGKRKRAEEDAPIMSQVSSALSSISKKLGESFNPEVQAPVKSCNAIFGEYVAAKMAKITVAEIRDDLEANIVQLINNALRECRQRDA